LLQATVLCFEAIALTGVATSLRRALGVVLHDGQPCIQAAPP